MSMYLNPRMSPSVQAVMGRRKDATLSPRSNAFTVSASPRTHPPTTHTRSSSRTRWVPRCRGLTPYSKKPPLQEPPVTRRLPTITPSANPTALRTLHTTPLRIRATPTHTPVKTQMPTTMTITTTQTKLCGWSSERKLPSSRRDTTPPPVAERAFSVCTVPGTSRQEPFASEYEEALAFSRRNRFGDARRCFEKLLAKYPHACKVWVSYAQMEKRIAFGNCCATVAPHAHSVAPSSPTTSSPHPYNRHRNNHQHQTQTQQLHQQHQRNRTQLPQTCHLTHHEQNGHQNHHQNQAPSLAKPVRSQSIPPHSSSPPSPPLSSHPFFKPATRPSPTDPHHGSGCLCASRARECDDRHQPMEPGSQDPPDFPELESKESVYRCAESGSCHKWWTGCRRILQRGLKLNPDSACLIQAWGLLELQRENWWAAVRLLERGARQDPSYAPVLGWHRVQAARRRLHSRRGIRRGTAARLA